MYFDLVDFIRGSDVRYCDCFCRILTVGQSEYVLISRHTSLNIEYHVAREIYFCSSR